MCTVGRTVAGKLMRPDSATGDLGSHAARVAATACDDCARSDKACSHSSRTVADISERGNHQRSPGWLVATSVDTGTDACCSRRGCLSIMVMCWSCGRIANAATGTSTRHPRTCLSARTSAPGAATARRTSCTGSARTAAASSSGAPSARPACSKSTPHRPSELSGQDALRHPSADPPIGEQEPSRPASNPSGTGPCEGTSHRRMSAARPTACTSTRTRQRRTSGRSTSTTPRPAP